MKKGKRILSVLLVVVMLLTSAPLTGVDSLFTSKSEAVNTDYKVGDHIEYGNYPQSLETDKVIIAQLDSIEKNWISYEYYSGSGSSFNGEMKPSDYMRYTDIDIDGDGFCDYRAVIFDKYRQFSTGLTAGGSNSFQDDNGYTINNIYYFKYEPLKWRVLDPLTGLIMCESIIDTQTYNNYISFNGIEYCGDSDKTYYANDYFNSSIRQWLNDDFYNTAFIVSQAYNIKDEVTLNNDCYDPLLYPKYNSQASKDKIFLLSYDEVNTSAFGFSSSYGSQITRQAKGTDYAKCQGLYNNIYSDWWLRSSGGYSYYACDVRSDGYSISSDYVNYCNGVRPACRLYELKSDITKTKTGNYIGSGLEGFVCEHKTYEPIDKLAPTCTEPGYITYTCTTCGDTQQKEILATGHQDTYGTKGVGATCEEDGLTPGTFCRDCNTFIKGHEVVPALGHKEAVYSEMVPPTCTADGHTAETRCKACGEVMIKSKVISALGHSDENDDGKCDNCGTDLGTHNPADNCSHICHKTGFVGFIWKMLNIFNKMFKTNKVCECGEKHY